VRKRAAGTKKIRAAQEYLAERNPYAQLYGHVGAGGWKHSHCIISTLDSWEKIAVNLPVAGSRWFGKPTFHRHVSISAAVAFSWPFLPTVQERLRKWSNVGIADDNFIHVQGAGAIRTAAQGYVTKLHVAPGSATAKGAVQSRAILDTIHPQLQ
jgi:hypothetical protein